MDILICNCLKLGDHVPTHIHKKTCPISGNYKNKHMKQSKEMEDIKEICKHYGFNRNAWFAIQQFISKNFTPKSECISKEEVRKAIEVVEVFKTDKGFEKAEYTINKLNKLIK